MLISKMVAAVFGMAHVRTNSVRNGEYGELHRLRFTPRIAPCFPYDRYLRLPAFAARRVARARVAAPARGCKAAARARTHWRLKKCAARSLTRERPFRIPLRPMPLPIVIADDSLLARKLLTKALPGGWDVDVAYAANGREALALYRDGKASVMFLDLTMPDMSGYQVLETLRHEDLNTFVIVVSADIQPQAQARVRELGAIAFVAKPVTSEALLPILKEYGLYA